jgi:hypothetical protein
MNPTDPDLESILRQAPIPPPPAGMKNRLLAGHPHSTLANDAGPWRSWWRQWWPALVAASITLICLGVLAKQQLDIQQLRQALKQLQSPPSEIPGQAPPQEDSSVSDNAGAAAAAAAAAASGGQEEVNRLRAAVQELAPEVAALEGLHQTNEKLRQQLATQAAATEEFKEIAQARDKARSIQCINNMKQLGLAARIWANDHDDVLPPSVLAMTQGGYMGNSPKILVCPADTGRQPAADPASINAAQVSYEYLAASASDSEVQRVMFRCPWHGHVTLCDGSVQAGVAKDQPGLLVNRGGVLYLERAPEAGSAKASGRAPARNETMSPEMRQRYGLPPAQESTPQSPSNP